MKKEMCFFSTATLSLFALIVAAAQASSALTLDEYLQMVQKKNRTFQSLEASQEAADSRYKQGDLDLSPMLTASGSYLDDKSLTSAGTAVLTHNQVRQYSLGLAKKFSTGTSASVTSTLQAVNSEGAAGATSIASENHTGTLGVSVSQSLWKDFFGQSTRLRHEREKSQSLYEKTGYNLQAKQALIDAEGAFWDLMYLQQELQLRKASLERAKKIEGWVRNRASNGIGDRADILNAQGLVASRELQLIGARDDLKGAQEKFADQIDWPDNQPLPELHGNLEQARPLKNFVSGEQGRVVRLDTYLSVLDAQVKQVNAKEAEEKVAPDLTLAGAYKTNGYDTTDSGAWEKQTSKDYPVSSVSLTFSWALDWDTKGAVRSAASKDALAAQLKKEKSLLDSETAWKEINRRHDEMSAKVTAAANLSQVQTAKAAAEREKLSKGRSITSNVITAEQDAADAELTLTKLKTEQRKLESQSRLFVKIQEGT
jgi:outer membrane protein TolC